MDYNSKLTALELSPPAARTSTVTGSSVNVTTFIGRLKITQQVGAVTGTTPTLNGKIQESADGSSDWQDITGATFTEVTASTSLVSIGVDARQSRGHIRYVGTIAGSTPSFTMAVSAVGEKQVK